MTFVVFSYKDLNWGIHSIVGFVTGNKQFILPNSGTVAILKIGTTSNVGFPGLYIYRMDQNNITEPNFVSMSKH